MDKLDLIFVTTGRHKVTEKIICEATNSIYSHAAIGVMIEGQYRIVEAVRPAVRIVPGEFFDDCTIKQVISLPITEDQRKKVVDKVLSVVGTPYGVDDCIIGGINQIFGEDAAIIANHVLGNESTIDCSGSQINFVREAFPDFAGDIPANFVTPEQARKYSIEYAEKMGVTIS